MEKGGGSPIIRPLLYGIMLMCMGLAAYLLCLVCAPFVHLVTGRSGYSGIVGTVLWWSGAPVLLGIVLAAIDIFWRLPRMQLPDRPRNEPVLDPAMTVVLTAYNDEASIGLAVKDFLAHPRTRRVIVVDNNSRDNTRAVASESGAQVICEVRPGYGRCVFRALTEGLDAGDTSLTLLCEGDMTFRGADIDKFLSYASHADIVNGTRIVEQLRARDTQLTTFMYYGNFFVGKLLEAKHLGFGTFTDVGTTYKLCHNGPLRRLLQRVDPAVNLEFNAHLLDVALSNQISIVECPVTFHRRVGESKGGNRSNLRALKVGLRMILGIATSWRLIRERE